MSFLVIQLLSLEVIKLQNKTEIESGLKLQMSLWVRFHIIAPPENAGQKSFAASVTDRKAQWHGSKWVSEAQTVNKI